MRQSIGRLSPANLALFVSLEIPMAAFLAPLVVYIPPFYAGEMGLGLATVGLVFGLTKLWDIVTDPIAGSVTDRYGPRLGRRRFWMLISLPIMLVGIYQVFLPPDEVTWVHFAFWMVVVYIGWTLLTISHISWGVELSDDYHERARIAAYRQGFGLVGSLIVVFIPVISDLFGAGTESARIAGMGVFALVALPVLMVLIAMKTPSPELVVTSETHSWRDTFTIIRHNRSLRALLLGNLGVLLGVAALSSAILFYVEHVLRLGEWATFAIVPLLFSGLLFLPVIKKLTQKYPKPVLFRYVLVLQIALQPLLLVVPPDNLAITVAVFLLLGPAHGSATFLPLAMIADLKDVETGNVAGRTGIYVALLQSVSKVSAALAVALMFLVLPLTGFDPDPAVVNSESSLQGLRYMVVLLPMACYALGWVGMRGYHEQALARNS